MSLRFLLFTAVLGLHAETGSQAWLRYEPLAAPPALPAVLAVPAGSAVLVSAQQELVRGIRGMTGKILRVETGTPRENAIVIQTGAAGLAQDAFTLRAERGNLVIAALNDRGALYGAFALLRKIALGEPLANLNETQTPRVGIRWVNEWANLDGSIERGYGGRSPFWDNNNSREDLTRATEYARLLASVGITASAITSVNANVRVLTPEFAPHLKRVADAMRPWGVQAAVAVDFGSPQKIGGLDTFDPLDPRVIEFWKTRVDALYQAIPDMAGIVLKADSEGRVGPAAYKRTHADAANVIARALKPHGGIFFYRGFVYNHRMDWNDPKNDRARAAVDNFIPLDGKFDDNVIIQIKNGPIDFQVREPASPLFGALEKTKMSIELQITQEYFGQGKHTVFLVPHWKDNLDFDLRVGKAGTPVKSRVAGFVGVSNVGLDDNWFGNHLSQANLYGYGRLAWNPDLTSERISDEWTRLTFGHDPKVTKTVNDIQLSSWRTYENYTGPLGLQTLTDIVGNHYSVNVEASERNGWGQWHRADEKGVGMDRTTATGTGFIGQYRPEVAKVFESIATCPDELLLFLHHVPYTHKLKSGSTVAQHLYDTHYEGAAKVAEYVRQWKALKPLVDEQRYREVLAQLEYQAGQAVVWRDAVARYFHKMSGIADAKGRVGNYPGRIEAESMQLAGYAPRDIVPWEAASGSKFVACAAAPCATTMKFDGTAGSHTITVQYFDMPTGEAKFRVLVGKQVVDEWKGTDRNPARRIDAGASTRRVIAGLALRPGDEIRIEGTPDRGDPAALDYVEVQR
jgi:alpha-glucuronidase